MIDPETPEERAARLYFDSYFRDYWAPDREEVLARIRATGKAEAPTTPVPPPTAPTVPPGGRTGTYMPGDVNADKWNNPAHNTPKYVVLRILSKYPPSPEGLLAAAEELRASGYGTLSGKDEITLGAAAGEYAGRVIDVGRSFSDTSPGASRGWYWGDTTPGPPTGALAALGGITPPAPKQEFIGAGTFDTVKPTPRGSENPYAPRMFVNPNIQVDQNLASSFAPSQGTGLAMIRPEKRLFGGMFG